MTVDLATFHDTLARSYKAMQKANATDDCGEANETLHGALFELLGASNVLYQRLSQQRASDLRDFCEAWIRGYIEENEVEAPAPLIERDIEGLHTHLCTAVDGFMADADITSPAWRDNDD